jgi:hypothetical protein
MKEDFSHLNNEERIRAENNVLKMKLMLEKGATFHEQKEDLPAEIEHEFLKHVIAFEKQMEEHKTIRVAEKLGNPVHFRPVEEIPEAELEKAWEELGKHMSKHGVSLDVYSPNISVRELYRFTTEELFKQEMDDFSMPGMMYCFIYDEFYPDPLYENGRAALDTIRSILNPHALECLPHLKRRNLRLNNKLPLLEEEFRWYVNQFKQAYECIEEPEVTQLECTVKEKYSQVHGTYKLRVSLQTEYVVLQGTWLIELEFDDELGYWYIFNVQVDGINF